MNTVSQQLTFVVLISRCRILKCPTAVTGIIQRRFTERYRIDVYTEQREEKGVYVFNEAEMAQPELRMSRQIGWTHLDEVNLLQ